VSRPALLMLHGWGLDAALWDGVCAALEDWDVIRWDRGYFGSPHHATPDRPVIAIGHSLGALMLALSPPPEAIALVAVNGFDRFAGEGAVPSRVVERMRSRFAEAPGSVLADFRERIGVPLTPAIADAGALADDLALLGTGDACGLERPPTLVLHGADDPLLPAEMREATFAGAPRETLEGAGHLLPLTHAGWVAARIRAVAA
jgi:pimeloyl-[acyl-carrier protein] methyl ester esterase